MCRVVIQSIKKGGDRSLDGQQGQVQIVENGALGWAAVTIAKGEWIFDLQHMRDRLILGDRLKDTCVHGRRMDCSMWGTCHHFAWHMGGYAKNARLFLACLAAFFNRLTHSMLHPLPQFCRTHSQGSTACFVTSALSATATATSTAGQLAPIAADQLALHAGANQ